MDYQQIARDTTAMLRDDGVAAVLEHLGESEYTAATSEAELAARTFHGYAVLTNFETKDIDGALIQVDDVQILLSPLQTNGQTMPDPKSPDRIKVGTDWWNVVRCRTTKPGGVEVLHKVQARK